MTSSEPTVDFAAVAIDAEPRRSVVDRARAEIVQRLADRTLEIPVLPHVAQQAMAASADESYDARRLADIIHRDQAMATHILRVANSPLYMPCTPIVSLRQAISRLGMKVISQIAMIVTCQAPAFRVAGYESQVRDLYQHSLASGILAQEIARRRRWNVEEAFLCGLLHDLGRPVALHALVDIFYKLGCPPTWELLKPLLDELHPNIGAILLESWKMPVCLQSAVLFHHHPEQAGDCVRIAQTVRLADDLAHWVVTKGVPDVEPLRKHPMIVPLHLYPEQVDELFAQRARIQETIEAVI